MIGRINHIAIAVPDVAAAARQWETMLGAKVSAPQTLPDHGVRIVFVSAPNGKIELMEPFGDASPIASFLAHNENGGMHHICYEVDDIDKARNSLQASKRPATSCAPCLLYTSPSPRDMRRSRMPSSA